MHQHELPHGGHHERLLLLPPSASTCWWCHPIMSLWIQSLTDSRNADSLLWWRPPCSHRLWSALHPCLYVCIQSCSHALHTNISFPRNIGACSNAIWWASSLAMLRLCNVRRGFGGLFGKKWASSRRTTSSILRPNKNCSWQGTEEATTSCLLSAQDYLFAVETHQLVWDWVTFSLYDIL